MATVRGTLVVLTYIYPVLGIFGLFMASQQTRLPNIVYTAGYLAGFMHIDPPIVIGVFWIVLMLTIACFLIGRMAMKKKQSDKMLYFAVFVFVWLFLQVVAEIYLYACRPDPTAIVETIKRKFIAEFDTIPEDVQEGIQEIQQDVHCCGISSWRDFHKAPSRMPDSCCGRYSPSTDSIVGHCTESELEQTPGCKDYYYQMMRTPAGLIVFKTVFFAIQLLLSILAFIQYRRLVRQNGLANEQTSLLST